MLIVQEDEGLSQLHFSLCQVLTKRHADKTKINQHEDSPLLENDISDETVLSFYHFLHPIMLGVIFCVFAISSILSAFETVRHLSHSIRNATADKYADTSTLCARHIPLV